MRGIRSTRAAAALIALAAPFLPCAPAAAQQTVSAQNISPCGEARIPISSLPFSIDQPGSYFVTADLTGVAGADGITISSDDVTLDLNGYSLAGVPGSRHGVVLSGTLAGVCVRNGALHSWEGRGLDAEFSSVALAADLRAHDNGLDGLVVGSHSTVRDCWAKLNGATGLRAAFACTLTGVTAQDNAEDGISTGFHAVVESCSAFNNGAIGISASGGAAIRGCVASSNTAAAGIRAFDHATIEGCTTAGNQTGIRVGRRSTVRGCAAVDNQSTGIRGDQSTFASCTSSGNVAHGFDVVGASTLVDCTATENALNGIQAGPGTTVRGCTAIDNSGLGIFADGNSHVIDCNASSNDGGGIDALSGSTVARCNVAQNPGLGIRVASSCRVAWNHVRGASIRATGSSNQIESNNVLGGLFSSYVVQGTNNLIAKNSGSTSGLFTPTYDVASGNQLGPVTSVSGASSPWGNIDY